MTYTTIREFNITGIEGIFLYAAEIVPAFIPMLLLAVFIITLFGTFFSQKRLTGNSDFLSSFAVAGWFTTVIAFILSLTPNLVNIYVITVCITVAIIGTILLLTSGERVP